MAHNPSRRCSQTTRQGEPCRAWAVRDTDPPLCSAHADRDAGAGPPPGNQNRRTHGLYAKPITDEELARIAAGAGTPTLDVELLCARIALSRVMDLLIDGRTCGPGAADLTPGDYVKLTNLAFQGTRTIARLLRDNHALAQSTGGDALSHAIDETLDALSEEWGIDL
jgi:hypothetical protein